MIIAFSFIGKRLPVIPPYYRERFTCKGFGHIKKLWRHFFIIYRFQLNIIPNFILQFKVQNGIEFVLIFQYFVTVNVIIFFLPKKSIG